MPGIDEHEGDPALEALSTLEAATAMSIAGLNEVQDQLSDLHKRRLHGWSWRRIYASDDAPQPLAAVTSIAANLGRASANFRRAVVRALHSEGMHLSSIGPLLAVSRQRVGVLLRHQREGAQD